MVSSYKCQPFGLIKVALVKSRESGDRIYQLETQARNSTPATSLVTVHIAGQSSLCTIAFPSNT